MVSKLGIINKEEKFIKLFGKFKENLDLRDKLVEFILFLFNENKKIKSSYIRSSLKANFDINLNSEEVIYFLNWLFEDFKCFKFYQEDIYIAKEALTKKENPKFAFVKYKTSFHNEDWEVDYLNE